MTSINDDWLLYEYERTVIVKNIENNLNQINQRYFEGNHGILSVTDNGDYVTVKNRGVYIADYDTQKLFDALENFSQEDYKSRNCYDLWDYLDDCEYTLPENQKSDNELKTDEELTFSQKRQAQLVDMLLGEPVITKTSISNEELWEKNRELTKLVQQLKWETLELNQSIEEMHDFRRRELKEGSEIINRLMARIHELEQNKEYSQTWIDNLKQKVHDLECAVHLLQQENKHLKSNQTEPKPTTKKRPKFKLPENFADYQQECDDLIIALSCFYSVKKGKWGKDILQFILTPTDTEKANQLHPYPDKWKAGLYLQPGQWTMGKVNLSDPDEWEEWFMDINDFADSNDIEIS